MSELLKISVFVDHRLKEWKSAGSVDHREEEGVTQCDCPEDVSNMGLPFYGQKWLGWLLLLSI